MSRLVPDFKPLENYYHIRPNTAIQAEVVSTEPPASLNELKEIIRKFSIGLRPEDIKKFQQASMTSKLCIDNRATTHYWDIICMFLVQSIRETYDDVNIDELECSLKKININEYTKDRVDNTSFIVYLLGILNGLL